MGPAWDQGPIWDLYGQFLPGFVHMGTILPFLLGFDSKRLKIGQCSEV